MRPSDFRHFLALFLLPALGAQEPGLSSAVAFRGVSFGRDMLLRDSVTAALAPRANFPLPPGGQELELQPTSFTPYDRYFGSVRAVIAGLEPEKSTMARACHLMKVGHHFDYVSRDPYRPDPPKLTQAQRAGDCKSKALWLYDNLSDAGALLVIGKQEKGSRTSHAWVYWRSGGRWWILDCTDRIDPIAADSVAPSRYIPYYSFGKSGTYRHEATRIHYAQNTAPGAAGGARADDRRTAQ